jgi:hypothetical protein
VADEDEDEELSQRLDFKIAAQTYRYLLALKRRRTHGNTVTAIVRRFIDEGIQDAIDRKYIALQSDDDERVT